MAGEEGDMLTTEQAMELLRVSRITIYRWVQTGRLHPVKENAAKLRQRHLFRRSEVEALLSGQGQ